MYTLLFSALNTRFSTSMPQAAGVIAFKCRQLEVVNETLPSLI